MKRIHFVLLFIFSISLFLFHCATTGPGGKKSLILISTSDEVSIGQSMSKEVETQNKVVDDPEVEGYVNRIVQK